jgi:hypothetical protein
LVTSSAPTNELAVKARLFPERRPGGSAILLDVRFGRVAVVIVIACVAVACGKVSNSGGTADAGRHTTDECNPPKLRCNGKCVSMEDDSLNCGACGAACSNGDSCSGGTCVATACPGDETSCGGLCVDTQTNPLNCGACSQACGGTEICVAGACICDPVGHSVCGGVCTDVSTSNTDCGACGKACDADQVCGQGACVSRCASGLSYCNGSCVDLSNDSHACGGCDAACPGAEACVQGKCACPDDAQHALCDGACVDLTTDGTNCGTCGKVCPAGNRCLTSPGLTAVTGVCTGCYGFFDSFFFCPPMVGDPLAICRAQAATVRGQGDAAGSDALLCQCNHCLTELTDCAGDQGCIAGWQCAAQKGCTEPCWDTMGACSMNSGTVGTCWKFCPPSTGTPQSMTRAEALFRCTQANGCGIGP